jgi:hypothetical protein
MKRVGRLFDAIVDRDNLRLGFLKACRGKRDRHVVYRFARGLERRLAEMADKLRQGTFPLGRCTSSQMRKRIGVCIHPYRYGGHWSRSKKAKKNVTSQ